MALQGAIRMSLVLPVGPHRHHRRPWAVHPQKQRLDVPLTCLQPQRSICCLSSPAYKYQQLLGQHVNSECLEEPGWESTTPLCPPGQQCGTEDAAPLVVAEHMGSELR